MSTASAPGLGRAALYATLATALERTVALGIALYLPRHLPLDDFGRYAFVLAFFLREIPLERREKTGAPGEELADSEYVPDEVSGA